MDNSDLIIVMQRSGQTIVPQAWLLSDDYWADLCPRSNTITPLYVQRYSGPRDREQLTWHEHWELIYVLGGQGDYDTPRLRRTHLTEGSTVLIPPRLPHCERSARRTLDSLWVGLRGSLLHELPLTEIIAVNAPDLGPLCEMLWLRSSLPPGNVSGAEIDGLTLAIVSRILKATTSDNGDNAARRHGVDQRVTRLVRYIHDNLDGELSVATLAAAIDLSEGHLSRWFRQIMGMTPATYVVETRLALARQLLQQSALPIKQIAKRTGFNDPLHFSRVFHDRVGIGPRQWREREAGHAKE